MLTPPCSHKNSLTDKPYKQDEAILITTPDRQKKGFNDMFFREKELAIVNIPGLQKNSYSGQASGHEEAIMITTPDRQKKRSSDMLFKEKEPIIVNIPGLQQNNYSDEPSELEEAVMITSPVITQKPKVTDEAFKSEAANANTNTWTTISTTTDNNNSTTTDDELATLWRYLGKADDLKQKKCQRLYSKKGSKRDLGLFYDREEGEFYALGAWCGHMGTSGSLSRCCVCCEFWLFVSCGCMGRLWMYLSVWACICCDFWLCQFGLCLSVVAVWVSCGCTGQFLLYAWSV